MSIGALINSAAGQAYKKVSPPSSFGINQQGASTSGVRFGELDDLQQVSHRGSAFNPEGGLGRILAGGMWTKTGLAGANFQAFG